MKKPALLSLYAIFIAALLGWVPSAHAYPDWSDCAACHGAFSASPYTSRTDGQSWANSLHNVHRTNMLSGDCNVCHVSSGRTPVYMDRSQGGNGFQPIGCVGCHDGPGLREHHEVAGADACYDCHGGETPAAEKVARPYYFTPDAVHPNKPTDGCNGSGRENFAGGPLGLDNDGNGLYDSADPSCAPVVQPPSADAGPAQSAREGASVTLNGSNSTGSGLTYRWTQTAGPAVTLATPAAVTTTFLAPQVTAAGASLSFQLTVTDSTARTSSATTTVSVTDVNQPPVANAGAPQTVLGGSPVTLDGSNSSDADGAIASYRWTQTGGPAVTLSNATAAKPSFVAPPVGVSGASLAFQLTVTDNGGLTATATTLVNVTHANEPPVAAAGPNQTQAEGATVTLDGSNSSDAEGTIASYRWTQTAGPAVTLSSPTAGKPTFVAPAVPASGASLTFQLTVTDDGGLSATATTVVNVTNVNQPPVAGAGPNQTVAEGTTVTLDGSNSSDPDGTVATYRWSQTAGPAVTLSNPGVSKPTFTAPTVAATGAALTFQLTVTDDGGLTATATTVVNVSHANRPPIANAGANQTVSEGTLVSLDGSASSDPDGAIASYRWAQTAGPAVTLSDPAAAKTTFAAPAVGPTGASLTFELTVADSAGLASTNSVIVNVSDANRPPVADAGANQTVQTGVTVTLDGSVSSDPDGAIASYAWSQTAGPSVVLSDPLAAQPAFTAPSAAAALTFQLTATDDGGLSSTASVTVTISAPTPQPNEPPTANPGTAQTVSGGSPVTLDGSGSFDVDGAIVSYAWAQTGGTPVTLSTPSSARTSFAAPAAPAGGTLTFRLTVTDDGGLSSTATVAVTVTPQPQPGPSPTPVPPVAEAGPSQTARSGAKVTLDGSRSAAGDGSTLTYRWSQRWGIPVTLSGAATANPSFTAPGVRWGSAPFLFELKVTNGSGLSAVDRVLVTVTSQHAEEDDEDDEEDHEEDDEEGDDDGDDDDHEENDD